MQKLGQHFLINKSALRKIAEAVDIQEGDTIIEIGPGHGELTKELLAISVERLDKNPAEGKGIKIIAIEKDPALAQELRKNFQFSTRPPDRQVSNAQIQNSKFIIHNSIIEIIEGDAREILPSIIHHSSFVIHNYKLVGNIPYYLTGYLLRIISELENKPSLCVFTIQKEVAERIVAQPPKMNPDRSRDRSQQINETSQRIPNIPDGATSANHRSRSASNGMNKLSASVQFWAEPKILQILPRRDFKPAPKVDSAIITLSPRIYADLTQINAERYYRMVKILFQQPRKTILNNLSTPDLPPREEILKILQKLDILPNDRPQNLSVEQIIAMAQALKPR